ncbi:aspartyl-phosphate phosphatase Spo0E family protein [Aquibacillus saliphilus]|uniref:aspartyl-phosphate phosphatase Spo0E family protein n=1 Tax=Aquibacillus saliphilus TaxID=1909422 RepID=UPI001CF070F0|nr:aspartyl-phosphate phosphatase Spo0E family protein [Aquibacillus saliphilus]
MVEVKHEENKIEKLRLKMYQYYQENQYEEVVKVSQELDQLLNEFLYFPKSKNHS